MKKFLLIFALAFSAVAVPLTQTGCKTTTTLEQPTATTAPGTFYTSADLAVFDQGILTARLALDSFVQWEAANAVFLAKYPEVHALAVSVKTGEDQWTRDAYAARDAYASAVVTYTAALAAGQAGSAPDHAKIDAALALLQNLATQVAQYRAAHPAPVSP